MNVNFNPNYSNNSVNFGALKNVSGMDKLKYFAGNAGQGAHDLILSNLKANTAFEDLCNKFDVYVCITPHIKQVPNSIFLEKILSLEILASKLKKEGFLNKLLGLFSKKQTPFTVTKYISSGTEAKTYNLAEYITKNFINSKEGLELDINQFLNKFANTNK